MGEEAEWLATSLYGPRVAPHLENFREMYGVAAQDAEGCAWIAKLIGMSVDQVGGLPPPVMD